METKKINEDFFSKPSFDMCYVLGLLYSDGYLCQPKQRKKYVAIKLIDEQILIDINKRMGNNSNPKNAGVTSAGNKLYIIKFNNQKLISDLEKIGLHERKTFTVKFPDIPTEYVKDFVRGIFDGDGCIHVGKRKDRVNSFVKMFSILGTEDLLQGIARNLPCNSYIGKYKKIFRLTVNKEIDINKIYEYLYRGNDLLYLNRKKVNFEHTIEIISNSKESQKHYVKIEQEPRLSKEEFVSKAQVVHGSKYNYSLVKYTKNDVEVKIICPVHGIFKQVAQKHLIGHNCQKCSGSYMDSKFFEEKAKNLHNDTYDYSLVEYKNSKTNVKIICPIHGEFEQTPSNHLLGRGCKECGSAKRRKQKKEDAVKLEVATKLIAETNKKIKKKK